MNMFLNLVVAIVGMLLITAGVIVALVGIGFVLAGFYRWLGSYFQGEFEDFSLPQKALFMSIILLHGFFILGVIFTWASWPAVPNLGLYWRWEMCHCVGSPPYLPAEWDKR